MANIPFWDEAVTEIVDGGSDGYYGATISTNPWDRVLIASQPTPGLAEAHAVHKKKHDKKSASGTHGGTTSTHGHDLADIELKVHIWTPAQWDYWQSIMVPLLWPVDKPQPKKSAATATLAKPTTAEQLAANLAATNALLERNLTEAGLTFFEPAATERNSSLLSFEESAKEKAKKKKAVDAAPQALDIFHPGLALWRIRSFTVVSVSDPIHGSFTGGKVITVKGVEHRLPAKGTAPVTKTATASYDVAPELQGDTTTTVARQPAPSQDRSYTDP